MSSRFSIESNLHGTKKKDLYVFFGITHNLSPSDLFEFNAFGSFFPFLRLVYFWSNIIITYYKVLWTTAILLFIVLADCPLSHVKRRMLFALQSIRNNNIANNRSTTQDHAINVNSTDMPSDIVKNKHDTKITWRQ